jgi:putative transposase
MFGRQKAGSTWPRSSILSRRVVGWSIGAALDGTARHRCAGDDDLAMGQARCAAHLSDRGSQYTSEQFQWLMADHGVVCFDEPIGQRFGQHRDWRARNLYRARDDAKAVFDYRECFRNPKRRHLRIGYMSPMEFERQAGLA